MTNRQFLTKLEGHTHAVAYAAFSPDSQRIVTASEDKTARVWSVANGQLLVKLEGHTGPVWHAAFWPDGRRIVSVSRDGTGRVYRVVTLSEIAELLGK